MEDDKYNILQTLGAFRAIITAVIHPILKQNGRLAFSSGDSSLGVPTRHRSAQAGSMGEATRA